MRKSEPLERRWELESLIQLGDKKYRPDLFRYYGGKALIEIMATNISEKCLIKHEDYIKEGIIPYYVVDAERNKNSKLIPTHDGKGLRNLIRDYPYNIVRRLRTAKNRIYAYYEGTMYRLWGHNVWYPTPDHKGVAERTSEYLKLL